VQKFVARGNCQKKKIGRKKAKQQTEEGKKEKKIRTIKKNGQKVKKKNK